jgi:hypothetical protein
VVFVECDHFVHRFLRGIATPLGLLDLLRVAPLLYDEVEDVEHIEIVMGSLGAALWDLVGFDLKLSD